MPGTVNAHLHLELSHVRVPGGDGLVPWVRRLLASRTPTNVEVARAAAKAMAARGTVAAIDISNDGGTGAAVGRRRHRSARAHRAHRAARRAAAQPARGARDGARRLQLRRRRRCARWRRATAGAWRRSTSKKIRPRRPGSSTAAARSPTSSPSATRCRRWRVPGLRPIAWLDSLGVLGPGTLLVHLTVADSDSLERAARARLHRRPLPALEPAHRQAPPARRWHSRRRAARRARHRLARVVPDARRPRRRAGAGARRRRAGVARARGHGRRRHRHGRRHLGALSVGKRPGLIAIGDDQHGVRDPMAWIAHEGADAPVERIA